jgi:hypothetical protein
MSCCDDSTFKIVNNSGQTITVTKKDNVGSFRPQGSSTVANNGTFTAMTFSAGGSKGVSKGEAVVAIGETGQELTLNYAFTPKGTGNCPCKASTSAVKPAGNYSAAATTSDRQKNKKGTSATVTWTITAGFARP